MLPDSPRKLAEAVTEAAHARASLATKLGTTFLLLLALLWLGQFEPLVSRLRRVATAADRVKSGANFLAHYEATKKTNADPAKIQTIEANIRTNRITLRKEIQDAKVVFPIPGLQDLEVPTKAACLVWSLFLLASVAYLYFQRKRCFAQLEEGARILDNASDVPSLGNIVALPWWMAPFPKSSVDKQGRSLFDRLAGINGSFQHGTFLIGIAFMSLLAIHARVCFIGYFAVSELERSAGAWAVFQNSCLLLGFAAHAYLVIVWFAPPIDTTAPQSVTSGRRQFLAAVSAATFSAVFMGFPVWQPRSASRYFLHPRFRRKPTAINPAYSEQLRSGEFYENTNSKVVHFVSQRGTIYGSWNPRNSVPLEKHLRPAKEFLWVGRSRSIPTLCARSRHGIIEAAAYKLRNSNDADAKEFLLGFLSVSLSERRFEGQDPNLRLCYLLASYCLIDNDWKRLTELCRLVERLRTGSKHAGTAAFENALATWNNPTSNWRKRIARRRM